MNSIENYGTEEVTIDLVEIIYLLRAKILIIVAFFLLGGLLSGLYTQFFITPKYKATAKIYVVSASSDSVVNLSDLQIGTSLTSDYKQLILSRPMLESVIQSLSLKDMTAYKLKQMIDVSNPSGTRILEISVTSTDPVQAKDIANEMANYSIFWLPAVMESNQPNIVEEAVLPQEKSSPNLIKNTFIGAVIFAMLYAVYCVVKFMLNDTIKNEEDMEHYFGMVPLASIPEDKTLTVKKTSLYR